MIRIMYQHNNYGEWECIGSYLDLREATTDLDRYKRSTLGETGRLKMVVVDGYKEYESHEEEVTE